MFLTVACSSTAAFILSLQSFTVTEILKKKCFLKKAVTGETLVHFVLRILSVLTLASDMAVLYGNDAFSILVLSTLQKMQILYFGQNKTNVT